MVSRHQFIKGVHRSYRPRSYLEIGVNDGRSLALSRVPSIGVDPEFKVTAPISCDVRLVKATSDAFFARKNPTGHLPGETVDFAFIDGMHLFEFVLRDFINVEKYANPHSVILIDDVLPRSVDEAARDRHTSAWTGDVFKIIQVLGQHRPDLTLIQLDTKPTGLLMVLGADPGNSTLRDSYDQILSDNLREDPQEVPSEILERTLAQDAKKVLESSVWAELVKARDSRRSLRRGKRRVAKALRRDLG